MVYNILRDGILNGVFPSGQHLRQGQLAAAIGVSRIPVRSALLQLEAEGLIEFLPYRGARVSGLTPEEMRENYEIRALLEAHALRKAMQAMTPGRLDQLEGLARRLNEVDSPEEFLQRRTEFYRELYDGDRQPQLVALIEKLRTDAGRYWLQRNVGYVARPGERDHLQVLQHIRDGDPEGAVDSLVVHLRAICDQLVALMEQRSLEQQDV
ncbi:MAG: GntR family transcriptional regulator [Thermoleophilia bacterium]|nr:GntR family transcriptional regulator [Thermoleophilia bacterium]